MTKADFTKMKLGRLPVVPENKVLKLSKYFGATLPPAPLNVDYTKGITSWGMMLNDTLGDCTIAGCGHAIQVWTANISSEITVPDVAILQKYELWAGYNPANPATDQGAVEVDILKKWIDSPPGIWNRKLTAFADPNPQNLAHVCKAIELFGGVYIGLNLPLSAQSQPTTWDISSNTAQNVPGSWGGHCVFVPKYTTVDGVITFTCITWGEEINITEAFWMYETNAGAYIEEVHALISPDWIGKKGTPEGFNLAQLEADLPLIND